mmetsp:Transcript_48770/g.130528  ORF Transcript_48770/g.130528 Transcript_48770/m.130528 type:complete len:296 (-) Transcript_48770:128-1015(-)
MVAVRLPLLFLAFGASADGLRLGQEGAEEWGNRAVKRERPQKKLGAFGATSLMLKTTQKIEVLKKEYADMYKQYMSAKNFSANFGQQKEDGKAKAAEITALLAEKEAMLGKHAIYNKTLAAERRKSGDRNKTGLWIITDEPETKEERGMRRLERDIRKTSPQDWNASRFLEMSQKAADQEEVYAKRAEYYSEKAEDLSKALEAQRTSRSESTSVLKDNFDKSASFAKKTLDQSASFVKDKFQKMKEAREAKAAAKATEAGEDKTEEEKEGDAEEEKEEEVKLNEKEEEGEVEKED